MRHMKADSYTSHPPLCTEHWPPGFPFSSLALLCFCPLTPARALPNLPHLATTQAHRWVKRMAEMRRQHGVVCMWVVMAASLGAVAEAGAPTAMFVFGDSLVDVGNNNHFTSLARANYSPYGIDRSDHAATGRFCNGRIIPDLMSETLGIKYPLPVLDPAATGTNILQGVNYASAGAGILDDTGSIFIGRITMPQQFEYFKNTKVQLVEQLGQAAADQMIADALYSFTVGGNDYINNYLLIGSTRASQYTTAQYQELLIATFKGQLETAYSLGMRKISVSNIGPIGCAPSELSTKSLDGSCVDSVQKLAQEFNAALKPLTEQLQVQLPGSTFVYANAFDVVMNIISNPAQFGFTAVNTACCGAGRFQGLIDCETFTSYCKDRSSHVFWDPFHPTEKVNILVANNFLDGGLHITSPMNVRQLLSV